MSANLVQLVENLGRPRVVVLGDLILDRYVWGDAERISQEAPVILLRADRREERLGGAASVASMLSVLGADVHLAGLVGDDKDADASRRLLDGLRHRSFDGVRRSRSPDDGQGTLHRPRSAEASAADDARRFRNPRRRLGERWNSRLAAALETRIASADVVLISDYDKGVCTPTLNRIAIDAAQRHGIKALVDPIRGGDYKSRYFGCTAMTPNRLEAGLAAGVKITDPATAMKAAEILRRDVGMEAGLVTLDKEGMVLVDDDWRTPSSLSAARGLRHHRCGGHGSGRAWEWRSPPGLIFRKRSPSPMPPADSKSNRSAWRRSPAMRSSPTSESFGRRNAGRS